LDVEKYNSLSKLYLYIIASQTKQWHKPQSNLGSRIKSRYWIVFNPYSYYKRWCKYVSLKKPIFVDIYI